MSIAVNANANDDRGNKKRVKAGRKFQKVGRARGGNRLPIKCNSLSLLVEKEFRAKTWIEIWRMIGRAPVFIEGMRKRNA